MPHCHCGGRGFESRPDRHDGSVAQLVEQRTENPRVAGSIPAGTTIRKLTCHLTGFFVFKFTFVVYYIVYRKEVDFNEKRMGIRYNLYRN